jgi:asparagine synthase (glutamine-hydrolysing)
VGSNYILCHEHLAIMGRENAQQPLFNSDKTVSLCVNGEIYNYKQIYEELKVKPTTQSDCEVVLHLYERYGVDCVKFLRGDFAFVLVDSKTGLFIIARDHLGILPLYWGRGIDGSIFVSSELKTIIKHVVCTNSTLCGC